MSLRSRMGFVETMQDLELAAEQRYWEGLELAVAGHGAASIYLLGYAAEMWIKLAYYHLDQVSPGIAVNVSFNKVKNANPRPVQAQWEAGHSIEFWGDLVCLKRQNLQNAFPSLFQAVFCNHYRSVHANWRVEMRYQPVQAYPREVGDVYDSVSWIKSKYYDLWR